MVRGPRGEITFFADLLDAPAGRWLRAERSGRSRERSAHGPTKRRNRSCEVTHNVNKQNDIDFRFFFSLYLFICVRFLFPLPRRENELAVRETGL